MSEATSPILFEAAENYANETSDVSIRPDLRMAFVAGAEWQWTRLAAKDAEIARLREALEPSAGTKAAYCGEFSFTIEDRDEDGEECFRHVSVPWTTVKEIMAAIRARAALEGALL